MTELTQLATDLPRSAAPVGPAEYQRVIARVRDEVARVVPPGSIVLVVSRGDEELIRFPNHKGWHFPRAAGGEYGGYHPEDSHAAIAHLEELRAAGATFLVLPRTAFWWLDYYGELAGYLETNARVLSDRRETCLIFAFEQSVKDGRSSRPAPERGARGPHQLADLVEALLPELCEVIVATREGEDGGSPSLRLGGRKVWRFWLPEPDFSKREPEDDPVSRLRSLKAAGAAYLIIPKDVEGLVRTNSILKGHLDRHCRLIASQRHVGTIFDLGSSTNGKSDPASRLTKR